MISLLRYFRAFRLGLMAGTAHGRDRIGRTERSLKRREKEYPCLYFAFLLPPQTVVRFANHPIPPTFPVH